MNKITYANKVDTKVLSSPEINKVTASTLNEVKTIVNETVDEVEVLEAAVLKARGTGVSTTYVSSVSVGGTTFAQPAISGEINSDEGYFSISYAGATGININDLSSSSTYVYIDKNGALQQQTTTPTRQDWTRKIFTMRIGVDTSTNLILGFEYLNNPIGHYANSIRDLYSFLLAQGVPFKKDQIITGRAADLGFDVSAGSFFNFGGTGDIYEPNTPSLDAVANADFILVERTTINGGGTTNLPKFWDNNGVLTALGSTTFVGHRLYRFSNGNFALQYGQANYANISLAKAGIGLEDYVLNPVLKNATFFGWWLIEDTATNTSGTTKTSFVEYTLGIQGGSSSSLSGALLKGNNLSDLLDAGAARTNLGLNTTANQTDSTDKRFVTDAQETIIDNTSGTNTGDQDLSGYLLNTTDTLTGDLTVSNNLTVGNNIKLSNSSFLTGRNFGDTGDVLLIGLDANDKVKIDANGLGTLISSNLEVGNDLTVTGDVSATDGLFSGDVGVGTNTVTPLSSGAATIGIKGSVTTKAGGLRIQSSDESVNTYIYGDNASGLAIGASSNHPIVFRPNATTALTLNTDQSATFASSVSATDGNFDGFLTVEKRASNSEYAISAKTVGFSNQSGVYFSGSNNGSFLAKDSAGVNGVFLTTSGSSFLDGGDLSIGNGDLDVSGSVSATEGNFSGNLNVTDGGFVIIDTKNVASNPRLYFRHDNLDVNNFIEVDRNTGDMEFYNNGSLAFDIATDQSATFASSLSAVDFTITTGKIESTSLTTGNLQVINPTSDIIYVGNNSTKLSLQSSELTASGAATFASSVTATDGLFSGQGVALDVVGTSYLRTAVLTNWLKPYSGNTLKILGGGANHLDVDGTATFTSSVTVEDLIVNNTTGKGILQIKGSQANVINYEISNAINGIDNAGLQIINLNSDTKVLYFNSSNQATFASSVSAGGDVIVNNTGVNSNSLQVYKGTLKTFNLWNATNGSILSLSSDVLANSIELDGRTGAATFASSVTATKFIGVKKETFNSITATYTLTESDYHVHNGQPFATSTVTVPTGLSTERSWEFSAEGFDLFFTEASGVTITVIANGAASGTDLKIAGGSAGKLVATDTANEFLLIK